MSFPEGENSFYWAELPDEKLLDLRICDLQLQLNKSPLRGFIRQLREELKQKQIRFRPHVWLSDDWFTPDGIPGIAIPFYLAHPRLAKLEERQLLDVEGGTPEWFMQLLRHESGHAIENAYQIRRRKKRQQIFGKTSQPYFDYYTPKPYSKKFVLHLDSWYAQSHPDEDFAETFAVWLTPQSNWRERYKGWPALKKLECVDEIITEISQQDQKVKTKATYNRVSTIKKTLGQHYEERRKYYGLDYPNFYDRDLRKLFSSDHLYGGNMKASTFLRKIRKEVRQKVSRWTSAYQYTINQLTEGMIERCDELDLYLKRSFEETKDDFIILLTVQTMNFLHHGHHRIAR